MQCSSVFLRILEADDVARTHRWINDPELNEIMGYLPISLRQQQSWFETTINNPQKFIFAICLQQTGEHIGNVALGRIDYLDANAMFSIFIADQAEHGKGYGSEATYLALKFGFDRLNLHKIHLKTSDYLLSAIRFYEGFGFSREGILREHEFKQGRFVDKILFSMLRSEFVEKYGESD